MPSEIQSPVPLVAARETTGNSTATPNKATRRKSAATHGSTEPPRASGDESPASQDSRTKTSTESPSRRIKTPSRRGSPFRARSSKLDRETLESTQNDFRGFFVLFWIAMSFYALLTFERNHGESGMIIGTRTLRLMSVNGLRLFAADMCMVASLFYGLILQWIIAHNLVPFRTGRLFLQHGCQSVWFFGWIAYIWTAEMPWIQTGFLTLHVIAMLFKLHSWNQTNLELHDLVEHERVLRKQLADLDRTATTDMTNQEHPHDEDARREQIQHDLDEIAFELQPGALRYPNNITFRNFFDYLLCPTLVYQLEYPRTDRVRISYVFEKILATLGTMFLMYISIEHYIEPVLADMKNMTFVAVMLRLLFPFMVCYLSTFYIIFECVANGFAEITRFADRNFYDDWWNSSSFDQFARRWNKPVHEFLMRHVYLESIHTYKISKKSATYITFFFSSCLHELAMIMVTKRVRMYLFVLQMFQIPLIWFGRLPWSRRNPMLGNAFFWFSMFAGPPLLTVGYCWEVYVNNA